MLNDIKAKNPDAFIACQLPAGHLPRHRAVEGDRLQPEAVLRRGRHRVPGLPRQDRADGRGRDGAGHLEPEDEPGRQGLLRRARGALEEGARPLGERACLGRAADPRAGGGEGRASTARRCATTSPAASSTPSSARSASRTARTSPRPGVVSQWQSGEFEVVWPPQNATGAALYSEAGLEVACRARPDGPAGRPRGRRFICTDRHGFLVRTRRDRPDHRRHLRRGRARPEPAVRADAHHEHLARRVPDARRLPHLARAHGAAGEPARVPAGGGARAVRARARSSTGCASSASRAPRRRSR